MLSEEMKALVLREPGRDLICPPWVFSCSALDLYSVRVLRALRHFFYEKPVWDRSAALVVVAGVQVDVEAVDDIRPWRDRDVKHRAAIE